MANIINVPIIVWKTDISLVGYVVSAVYVPEGLRSFRTGVSVHLNGNAFNCLLCFDKNQYESKVISIMQYFFSDKQAKDLELMDLYAQEANVDDSVIFEKKGSINCKFNHFYGFSNCDGTVLPNIISEKVSFFDVIKTDKYEISTGDVIVLSRRSTCEFVFFGALKVFANLKSRRPKYFNLVINPIERNKFFSFSLSQYEKKIESSKFQFDKTRLTLLQLTAANFAKHGLDTKILSYREPGNYLLSIYY